MVKEPEVKFFRILVWSYFKVIVSFIDDLGVNCRSFYPPIR